jgi:hypothetical protein
MQKLVRKIHIEKKQEKFSFRYENNNSKINEICNAFTHLFNPQPENSLLVLLKYICNDNFLS